MSDSIFADLNQQIAAAPEPEVAPVPENMVRVGPLVPSAYESELDIDRERDYGNFSTLVPAKVADRGPKIELTPIEKQDIYKVGAGVMFLRTEDGETSEEVITKGAELREFLIDRRRILTQEMAPTYGPDVSIRDLADQTDAIQRIQEEEQAWKETVTFGDQIGAAVDQNFFTKAMERAVRRLHSSQVGDREGFVYADVRKEVEAGRSYDERKWLQESETQVELEARVQQLDERNDRFRVMSAQGDGQALAAGLIGAGLDPLNLIAGAGITKAFRAGGIAGVSGVEAGSRLGVIGGTAAEAGAASVLTSLSLEAMGENVTVNDHIIDLAGSIGAGAVLGRLMYAGIDMDENAMMHSLRMSNEAVKVESRWYKQAEKNLGSSADKDALAAEVRRLVVDEYKQAQEISLAPVPDERRFTPLVTEDMIDPTTGRVQPPAELMLDDAILSDVIRRYNLDGPAGIAEPVELRMVAETIARSERMERLDPLDEARLNTVMANFPQLASSGLLLLRSKNVVLRAFASSVAESTTRASGTMRTAAMSKFQRLAVYRDSVVPEVDVAFKDWANSHGHGLVEKYLGTKAYSDFNKDLYRYRRGVERGSVDPAAHPSIVRASEALDRGFTMARQDMQKVGTIGAARLGEDSAGYMPRMWSTRWFTNASQDHLNAVARTISDQVQYNEGWDKDFADTFARRYMDHANERARGATEAPANLYDDEEAPALLQDVMRASGIDPTGPQAESIMGRFSRGGAQFTRKRIVLDETVQVQLPNGEKFSLADVFENDLMKLYQGYIERTSGEVALAQHGIYGQAGLAMIARAASKAGAVTQDEWMALSQVSSEMLGQPVKINGAVSYSRGMQNLRLLASSSMLGGMGFTQLAEAANAIGPLGLRAALRIYAGMPQAIADIRAGRTSPLLGKFEFISGEPGMEAHAVTRFMDSAGDILPVGAEDLNVMERALRLGGNATQVISAHRDILAAQHRLVGEQIMLRAIRFIKEGGDDVALKEMGLSKAVRDRLVKDIDNIATFDKDGSLLSVDPFAATDKEAMAILGATLTRGTRQIIQGTFIGETGRWAHSELPRFLLQFRTFPLIAMEKQLAHGLMAHGPLAIAGMMGSAMAFAIPIYLLRVSATSLGREDSEEYRQKMTEPGMLARAAMNYTSKFGLMGDLLDAGAAVTGGEMVGRQAPGGKLADNVPGIGYVNRAAKAVTEQDVADTLRRMPMGSAPGVLQALNALDTVMSEK